MQSPCCDPAPTSLCDGEWILSASWIISGESANAFWCSAAKRIDRLVIITCPDDRATPCGNESQNFEVAGIQILILIYDQEVIVDPFEIRMIVESVSEGVRQF